MSTDKTAPGENEANMATLELKIDIQKNFGERW
ncbi:hypothetical protein UNH65_25750 [Chitinophaga sp. 180180018-2]|nr:hypothetical protein [Chitinophaga sp. 212800010-3]